MSAGIVDTHTHLADAAFEQDLDAVLERARAAGIVAIVVVSETLADAVRVLETCRGRPLLRPALGLYPGHAEPDQAARVRDLILRSRDRIVAIGEVGLDHWLAKDGPGRELQREILTGFVDLAVELDLPLNVHSRSAGREAIELLVGRGARRVQMHAFDGRAATARVALEAGYYFSVPPSVAHSQQKRKLVTALPMDRILLETDSPVLGPVPGQRNEPANIRIAAREIAALRGVSEAAVLEAAWRNTRALYGDGF